MAKTLFIVVPCYNEQEVLRETAKRLCKKLEALVHSKKAHRNSKILFVNDGSKDLTWEIIKILHEEFSFIAGIDLAKNSD